MRRPSPGTIDPNRGLGPLSPEETSAVYRWRTMPREAQKDVSVVTSMWGNADREGRARVLEFLAGEARRSLSIAMAGGTPAAKPQNETATRGEAQHLLAEQRAAVRGWRLIAGTTTS